jgi:hypothetical protein
MRPEHYRIALVVGELPSGRADHVVHAIDAAVRENKPHSAAFFVAGAQHPRWRLDADTGCKKGFITAGSVGFIPLDYDFSDDRRGGIDFHRQELLEFSVVPVPANANSLVMQAVKSLARRGAAPSGRPEAALSTMSFFGTLEQREQQLHEATRAERHRRAHQLLAVSIAHVDADTREGRRRIARAFKRHAEQTKR